MTNISQWMKSNSISIVLYILGFVLFWEWLRPLEQVTDTANSYYFVAFSALLFFLYFFNIPLWLSFPVRLLILLYVLHDLFFEDSFFKVHWISSFYEDIIDNSLNILDANWLGMTDLFRSFLFLLLLWLMSYLIHYWLIEAKRIFVFFILTIIYLSVLDTFTPYDASAAIVRTVVIGFIILGSLQIVRIREIDRIPIRLNWFFILTIMIVLSIGLGYFTPKAGPQWPDPVPFIKTMAKGQNNSVNKIGYGIDDSNLGGSFSDDHTTVFTAEVKKVHYWRVETKDYYTGKGWEVSKYIPKILVDKDNINLDIYENVNNKETVKATISMKNIGDHPHIPYPVDLRTVEIAGDPELFVEPFTGKLSLENDQTNNLESYEVTYNYPKFSIDALKLANEGDNTYIKEIYTQLPELLPGRVKELATEITYNKPTRYEKVKAIESYFSKQGYKYEKRNVAIPQAEQDYVDQFLFETKKGYCDNFSTSMVILLRTIDIPTRWVKGYTQGDYKESTSSGGKLYEVKNSNAHSWVEVYFPGIGWVPFEPTRGFRNLYSFTENDIPATGQIEQTPQKQEKEETNAEITEEVKKDKKVLNSISIKDINLPLKELGFVIGLIGLAMGLLIKFRHRLYPYWLLANYRIRKDKQTPKHSFEILLLLLNNKGMPIKSGETIREYAIRVDQTLGTTEMVELVTIYERILYANSDSNEEWLAVGDLWENLIKKILA